MYKFGHPGGLLTFRKPQENQAFSRQYSILNKANTRDTLFQTLNNTQTHSTPSPKINTSNFMYHGENWLFSWSIFFPFKSFVNAPAYCGVSIQWERDQKVKGKQKRGRCNMQLHTNNVALASVQLGQFKHGAFSMGLINEIEVYFWGLLVLGWRGLVCRLKENCLQAKGEMFPSQRGDN